VDEDEMARNAWQRILSRSSQIEVIGETTPLELIRNFRDIPTPEIVVAGSSFAERGLIRSEKIRKQWGSFPKTIIVCENEEKVKAAFKARADWASIGPFSDQELITWTRALSDDAKRLCSEYLSELTTMEKGTDQHKTFLKLMQDILQLLFHPDLVNPKKMDSSNLSQEISRGRLIFRNQAKRGKNRISDFNEFWEDAREFHQAKYVTVDIYNSEIVPAAIQALGKYLSNLHGSLGLIIGRSSEKPKLSPLTVALFENEKKVVIMLSDTEIQEMLEYKAGGVNPACLLQDLYQNLIADAEN
jgi:DNA-binding NarL/FixJ family response regulator